LEYAAIALLVVVVAFVLLKKKSGSKRATRKKPQTRKAASNIKKVWRQITAMQQFPFVAAQIPASQPKPWPGSAS